MTNRRPTIRPEAVGLQSPTNQSKKLAACRTFLASAPEVLLAIITQARIDFEGYGSTFESALCQKAVRRAARRNGVCAATLTEEPLAARRALQPLGATQRISRVKSARLLLVQSEKRQNPCANRVAARAAGLRIGGLPRLVKLALA